MDGNVKMFLIEKRLLHPVRQLNLYLELLYLGLNIT